MTQFAIDVQGLTKIFDNRIAVDNVSLKVKKGSVFGFLGSNGSGKTTMIRMICGILTPSKGTGQCLGLDIETDRDVIKTKIGYMPQKFSLYSKLLKPVICSIILRNLGDENHFKYGWKSFVLRYMYENSPLKFT